MVHHQLLLLLLLFLLLLLPHVRFLLHLSLRELLLSMRIRAVLLVLRGLTTDGSNYGFIIATTCEAHIIIVINNFLRFFYEGLYFTHLAL